MAKTMNIDEEILKNFKEYAENYAKSINSNSNFDWSFPSMVAGISGDLYKIFYQKQEYYVKNGTGITFEIGDSVWITVPCNDFKKKYISAKR